MQLQLKKFKPETMGDDCVCVFLGKRNTGKSTLIKDIMYYKRHIPAGICMSGTEDGNHYYSSWIPDLFIYPEYDREAVERVMDRQKKSVAQGRKNCGAFLLFDDVMYDAKFLKEPILRQIAMNGRHWKLFVMMAFQYCMDMPPAIRSNIDYVFVLRENIVSNRDKIWKNFFGIFPTFHAFNSVMDQCTNDFECLVLDNTSRSNKIEDVVFWYKANLKKPKFRVGAPQFWSVHKKLYNPSHHLKGKDDEKPQDKKTKIVVKKKK